MSLGLSPELPLDVPPEAPAEPEEPDDEDEPGSRFEDGSPAAIPPHAAALASTSAAQVSFAIIGVATSTKPATAIRARSRKKCVPKRADL